MQVHLNLKSSNAKTGPIPVSTTSAVSCPDRCSLKKSGCYADGGPLAIHWKKVSDGSRGESWDSFCGKIQALPDGSLWRHNQAGDLPGNGQVIHSDLMEKLVNANKGKCGFTYTHYDPTIKINKDNIRKANKNGFTVNLSAESLIEADKFKKMNIGPVVTILPEDAEKVTFTPNGNKVVTCPATYREDVSCSTCKICADNSENRAIIGFPVHGVTKKKAQKVFMMKSV